MLFTTLLNDKKICFDTTAPMDISLEIKAGPETVNAFHIAPASIQPLVAGNFIGSVPFGGACNCENITFNAHGNGTHTECVGHVSLDRYAVGNSLKQFFFLAKLITVIPQKLDNDGIILAEQVNTDDLDGATALIIRTLPNNAEKMTAQYSGANPVYLHPDLALKLREAGIDHLLVDLPSVDREEDQGKLLAHKNFWNYPENPRVEATITELIYVPSHIADGRYLLNLMLGGFDSDAAPSKPILYELINTNE